MYYGGRNTGSGPYVSVVGKGSGFYVGVVNKGSGHYVGVVGTRKWSLISILTFCETKGEWSLIGLLL